MQMRSNRETFFFGGHECNAHMNVNIEIDLLREESQHTIYVNTNTTIFHTA